MLPAIVLVLKRLGWMAATLWIVFTITFVIMYNTPGGPFDAEKKLPPEIKRNVEARYGLNDPPLTQYLKQLGNVLRFDFGPSYRLNDWWSYGLPWPPPGYDWVRIGDDALLIDRFSGRVVQVVRNLFW